MTDLEAMLDDVQRSVGGGGGIVAKTAVEAGFKVFATGVSQEDAWFPFPPKDGKAKAQAQSKANALGAEHSGANVQFGVNIIVARDNAYVRGEAATWSVPSRHFFEAYWQESCKLVVMPSLKTNGIATLPWVGWARIGFGQDPYGSTELDQNGEERVRRVAYVTEVFADEAAALAAVESGAAAEPIPGFEDVPASGESAEGLPLPAAYQGEVMEEGFRRAIVALFKEGGAPEEVAEKIGGGTTVPQVVAWAEFYTSVEQTADFALPLAATKLEVSEDVVKLWRALL